MDILVYDVCPSGFENISADGKTRDNYWDIKGLKFLKD